MSMSERRKTLLLALLVVAVIFSGVAFIIPFPKGGVFWIAYIAELIAVGLQVPVFKIAFDGQEELRSKVLGFPVFRVGYLYLGVQTALSLALFALGFVEKFPVWLAALLCVIVLGAAVVCSLTADVARDVVQKSETNQKAKVSWMENMRTLSAGLPAMAEDSALKQALSDLAEDFRFSDPVSSDATADVEKELESKLREISGKLTSGSVTLDEVQTIRKLLAQRNVMCKAGKQ